MYQSYDVARKPDKGVRCSYVVSDGLDSRANRIGPRITCHADAQIVLVGRENGSPFVAIRCGAHAMEALGSTGASGPLAEYFAKHQRLPFVPQFEDVQEGDHCHACGQKLQEGEGRMTDRGPRCWVCDSKQAKVGE